MANGGGDTSATGQNGNTYMGWQIFAQAAVVILGLLAVVASLGLILDAYDVNEEAATTAATTASWAQQTTGSSGTSSQWDGQNGGGASTTSSNTSQGSSQDGGPTGPGGGSPTATTTPASDSTSVSSSSVVAILTPLMAGIVGIVGLFFGVSSTGSARGRQAGTDQTVANTTAKAADASAKAVDLVAEVRQAESSTPPKGQTSPQGDDF